MPQMLVSFLRDADGYSGEERHLEVYLEDGWHVSQLWTEHAASPAIPDADYSKNRVLVLVLLERDGS